MKKNLYMYSRSALRLNYNTHYSSFLKRGTFVNTCINTQFFIYKTIIRNCLYNHFIKKLKGVTIYRINFNLRPPQFSTKITYLGTRQGLVGNCFLGTLCITYLQMLILEKGSTWYSRIRKA